jgi:hypothetical protein
MGVSQSNLSDPHYGYDLVVAVSQAGVNATMKQFLADLASPEVTVCYVYDASNNLVPIKYETLLANANGSDPFKVAAGSDPLTDRDLINLTNANFAGAVRARLGLPDVPLGAIPPIVTLGEGSSAPVLFNLLCAEFVIAGFEYGPRGKATWINQSQPSGTGSPWYFSANVNLNSAPVAPDESVPQAVKNRADELRSRGLTMMAASDAGLAALENVFTIQKLFLDLDTAILKSSPTIVGIEPGWPVWSLVTSIFLGAYFTELRQKGNPVLNYSFTLAAPKPATLQLGSVSRECLRLLQNGQPISNPTPTQLEATTLVYCGSNSTTAPVAVPFSWNWVELSDVTAISGVQAVRRDVFFEFFINLLNQDVAPLCVDTNVAMSGGGLDIYANYTIAQSSSPTYFQPVATIQPPGTDGFTTLATISYTHNAHNSFALPLDFMDENGDFNYALTGAVGVSGNQIKIQIRVTVFMHYGHGETAFAHYDDLPGANYYDKTLIVLYTLGVNQSGELQVNASREGPIDNSAPWNLHLRGVAIDNGLTSGITWARQHLDDYIGAAFSGYVDNLTAAINGTQGWVFPGNDAFVFKNLSFSAGQDLVAQLTYVQPN